MSTTKETIIYILGKLQNNPRFAARAMFGEYALYADGRVVALVCDDMLYVKIRPESEALEGTCEKGQPYPGAKPHYIVGEDQFDKIDNLQKILFALASALPAPKNKTK